MPPVVRAVKVLRHIAAGRSVANQSRAAREIGINRTTLLRLLHTLEAESLIERVAGTDDFVLGPGVIELAARKIHSLDVVRIANPILARLAETARLSCHLGILDGHEVLYVLRSTPDMPLVSNVRIGTRMPAHASSIGRSILAHMLPREVDALYRGVTLKAVTARTPTTLAKLHADLDAVRRVGIVDSRSGYEVGIDSIAAPVRDHTGTVVAAINVSGPERAFGDRARRASLIDAVRDASAEISRRLGYVAEQSLAARR